MKKWIKPLASIKLAVLVIAALATLIAIGTFVEADYNAEIAAKMVYKTPWMFAVMGLLAVNLAAVMVDRWPWKRRHVPFLLAHIGILVLLGGSVLTMVNGIDGSIAFGIGEKNRFVQIQNIDLTVWMSFDGERYNKVVEQEVDFYKNPPAPGKYSFSLLDSPLNVIDYIPFAVPSKKIESSTSPTAGAGLRFQLQNRMANVTEWIIQRKKGETASFPMGPIQIHLGLAPQQSRGSNELFLSPKGEKLEYTVLYQDPKRSILRGSADEGSVIKPGWMDFEFRILRYLPMAEENWHFDKEERPNALTTSAIKVSFLGQEKWLQQDDILKFYTPNSMYVVSYGHRRMDLGFDMTLKEFKMGTYPGTQRASSYQSLVQVGDKETLISMNEPLKYNGLTFYQASFQSGPSGKPEVSILSVNFDPGRALKYIGSLILCLGVVWLFYDKRKAAAAAALRSK